MPHRKIVGIMAATPTGIVGKNAGLPWHYPEETAYFKKTTRGAILVMGRKTFTDTPRALLLASHPVVFSRHHPLTTDIPYQGVNTVEDFLTLLPHLPPLPVFMIGGAEIAHLFLQANLLDEFLLTRIHHPYPGDTQLNLDYFTGWPEEIIQQTADYTIVKLTHPQGGNHVI